MDYVIKQLSADDVGLLKNLLKVFGDAFNELETYESAVPDDTYLQSLLAKANFIALVAMDHGTVVGGLTAYVLEKFEQERREIYIYDLAVLKEHWRKGIATALINKLRDVAKQIDAYLIFVQADRGDDAAIQLYESFGKGEDVLQFDISLEK